MKIQLYVIPARDDNMDALSQNPMPPTTAMLGVKVWNGRKGKSGKMWGFLLGPETLGSLGLQVIKPKNSELSMFAPGGNCVLVEGNHPEIQ